MGSFFIDVIATFFKHQRKTKPMGSFFIDVIATFFKHQRKTKPFRNFIADIEQTLISKDKDIIQPAGRPPKRSLYPSVGRKPN